MMVFTQQLIDSDENITNKFEIKKLTNSLNDISMPLTYYQNQRVKNCIYNPDSDSWSGKNKTRFNVKDLSQGKCQCFVGLYFYI